VNIGASLIYRFLPLAEVSTLGVDIDQICADPLGMSVLLLLVFGDCVCLARRSRFYVNFAPTNVSWFGHVDRCSSVKESVVKF